MFRLMTLALLIAGSSIVMAEVQCDNLKKEYDAKMAEFDKIQKGMKEASEQRETAKYEELNVQYKKVWNEASQLKKDWQRCEDESKNKHKKAYNEGLKLKKDGNKAGALAKFEAAIKDDPNFEEAYQAACAVMLDMKRFDNFDTYIAKITDKEKKGALMYNRGVALAEANKFPDAIKAFGEVAKFYKPEKAYYRIGMIYHDKMSDFSSAAANFEKSIAADPKEPKVYEALGVAYMEMKSTPKAVEAFEKGTKVKDNTFNYSTLYSRLANAYNLLGNSKNALEAANKAIETGKGKSSGLAYLEKGTALKKMGNLGEAKAAFEKAAGDMATKKNAEYELNQLKK